jgi:hypothetical protein
MNNKDDVSLTQTVEDINEILRAKSLNQRLSLTAIKWITLLMVGTVGLLIFPFNGINAVIGTLSLLEAVLVVGAVGMFVSDIINTAILVFRDLLSEKEIEG